MLPIPKLNLPNYLIHHFPRHLKVLQRYVTETGEKLGSWISTQRVAYSNGELKPEQIEKLEAIGMIWNIKNNKSNIEQLCNEYNINYKKNKKYVDKLSFSIFSASLKYIGFYFSSSNKLKLQKSNILKEIIVYGHNVCVYQIYA